MHSLLCVGIWEDSRVLPTALPPPASLSSHTARYIHVLHGDDAKVELHVHICAHNTVCGVYTISENCLCDNYIHR